MVEIDKKTVYISRWQARQLLEHKRRAVERTVKIHGQVITISVELSD